MSDKEQAGVLVKQLGTYLLEAPAQQYVDAPSMRRMAPSPWQLATKALVSALVTVGAKFQSFGDVTALLDRYVAKIEQLWASQAAEDLAQLFPLLFSFQGFLDALGATAGMLPTDYNASLLDRLLRLTNADFLIKVETSVSSLQGIVSGHAVAVTTDSTVNGHGPHGHDNALWKESFKNYIGAGQQVGAMLINYYMCLYAKSVAKTLLPEASGGHRNVIDSLLSIKDKDQAAMSGPAPLDTHDKVEALEILQPFAVRMVDSLDEGGDYIELVTPEKIDMVFSTKSVALEIVALSVHFGRLDRSVAQAYVETSLEYGKPYVGHSMYLTVFKLAALLCKYEPTFAHYVSRQLTEYVANPYVDVTTAQTAARTFAKSVHAGDQDLIVSTVYTMANMLNSEADGTSMKRSRTYNTLGDLSLADSQPNDGPSQRAESDAATNLQALSFRNLANAIVAMASSHGDRQIATLALTVLGQKLNRADHLVDEQVILSLAVLAPNAGEKDFRNILRMLSAAEGLAYKRDDASMLANIKESRCRIARSLGITSQLFPVYLAELLRDIASRGDVQALKHHRSHKEISKTAEEITQLLPPLAALLPKPPAKPFEADDWETISLFRDAWFNMVVNGFSKTSEFTQRHWTELEVIAHSTPPLVSETSANKVESELELNTVLRRGSSNSNVSNQKDIMGGFSAHNYEIRSLSYPRLMFLSATVLLESLRVRSGNCAKMLMYFGDPGFRSGDSGSYMTNIVTENTKDYIAMALRGGHPWYTVERISEQLRSVLISCCHRVQAIQNAAFVSAEMIIKSMPSVLCQKTSLYTLLDLLTLLYKSCMDSELDEYEPTAVFTSRRSNIRLELSDSYEQRRGNLKRLVSSANQWLKIVLDDMAYDLKSLLSAYLAERGQFRPINDVALGCSVAAEFGGSVSKPDELSTLPYESSSTASGMTDMKAGFLSQYLWSTEFKLNEKNRSADMAQVRREIDGVLLDKTGDHSPAEVRAIFARASPLLKDADGSEYLTRRAVQIPFKFFTKEHLELGISLWLYLMHELPYLKNRILVQVAREWEQSIVLRRGLFSRENDLPGPEYQKMEYEPSNKSDIHSRMQMFDRQLSVHRVVVSFLYSAFHSSVYDSRHALKVFLRAISTGLVGMASHATLHPLARTLRFEFIKLALDVYDAHARLSARVCETLKGQIFDAALSWFAQRFHWPYGGNRLQLRADQHVLRDVAVRISQLPSGDASINFSAQKQHLVLLFLNDELTKLAVWADPLQTSSSHHPQFKFKHHTGGVDLINDAWRVNPRLAVFLAERNVGNATYANALRDLTHKDPLAVENTPEALKYFLSTTTKTNRRFLLYWAPVGPIEAINLFLPAADADSYVIQYAMRTLESHDVNLVFFYVPQIVQALRYDSFGYVERFILRTAKVSQLFAHQIIWNILANSYRDDDMEEPDPMKPTLDRVVETMTSHFDPQEREFYEREFAFFNEVTDISGKLKPYIKKSKAEKKAKIDEEINKIKVDVGVYLPSNPDGVVVAIDRKSGRPLQSHAKAPFLARFRIRREIQQTGSGMGAPAKTDTGETEDALVAGKVDAPGKQYEEVWQSAIFKVGDDVRQDVLALQIISVFRTIFRDSGLDVYVYPNRVTATAPGRGVIDVLRNSISRDMLGREAVNGLYEYFTSKFGGEDSLEFQKARNAFVKSLAAYSVISYLIQFKDRHNGNIMYDDEGHILHIDFGFCFDIVPGGVKFEQSPFKLTSEMVAVMGGSTKTQAYRWFEELCVKAFLDCRPYAETIIQVTYPMISSGLPCFKGETSIKRLRARYVLDKSERDAALYFRGLIKKSFESISTKGYDEFQRITNGIPY